MKIWKNGSRPARQGQAEWFTGTVRIDPIAETGPPARVQSALVTFSAGARTAWHTHPLGQTLVITQGQGLAQAWDEAIQIINAGDVIWFAAGEKHWHGAAPETAISHIAIHESFDGKSVEWLEHVSDAQYRR